MHVCGIARTNTILHPQFNFIQADFTSIKALQAISLPDGLPYSKIVLINNAGILGEINHLGKLNSKIIVDTFTVNTIAPTMLMNSFLEYYSTSKAEKVIINVSSGAGRHEVFGNIRHTQKNTTYSICTASCTLHYLGLVPFGIHYLTCTFPNRSSNAPGFDQPFGSNRYGCKH